MDDDKKIIAQAEDKIEQCFNRNFATHTGFLDMHQQSILRGALKHINPGCQLDFYGGYEEAERTVLLCYPDYLPADAVNPLVVLRATRQNKGGKSLTHRDYLGSLVGLGIRREVIGDILVREDGADIIVLEEMAPYILQEYGKAGRVELSVEQKTIDQLIIPERKTKTVATTVASLRLDNTVAAGFGLSRSKAVAAIQSGLVFVNHIECTKPDRVVQEGDLITLRRSGRIRLVEVGGTTRKDRTFVRIERY